MSTNIPRTAVGAVIVAAGRAARMNGTDKIFAPLAGRLLISRTLEPFLRAGIDRIVLVVADDRVEEARHLAHEAGASTVVEVVAGGDRRRDSVRAGLVALADREWVLVHDGARPLVTEALIAAAIAAAAETGAAVPALVPVDTIKRVDPEGRVVATPPRAELRAVQTPQAFRRELLIRAHEAATDDATDDSALVERLGVEVRVFPGDPRNIKITHGDDLAIAAALLGERVG